MAHMAIDSQPNITGALPAVAPPLVPEAIPEISGWYSMLESYAARIPTFDAITLVDYPPVNPTDAVPKRYVDELVETRVTGVSSFNGRTGPVTLLPIDVANAGGLLTTGGTMTGTLVLNGNPVGDFDAVTKQYLDNNFAPLVGGTYVSKAGDTMTGPLVLFGPPVGLQDAVTKAYVDGLVGASASGVVTWNNRSGVVTMNTSDILAAGGAPIVDPIFGGIPQGPTPPPGTSNTQLATTAYVSEALATRIGNITHVSSWNGRTGAVTFTLADLVAAGGASLNNPIFTGDPQAPTPSAGDNDNSVATTAFVHTVMNTSLASSLAGYLPLSGGTLAGPGNLAVGGSLQVAGTLSTNATAGIGGTGVVYSGIGGGHSHAFHWDGAAVVAYVDGTPIGPLATQAYAASIVGSFLPISGGTITGSLTVNGNLAVVGVTSAGNVGINYPVSGQGNYHAFGWDGSFIQGFVNGTYVGQLATADWANNSFATYAWVNGNFKPAGAYSPNQNVDVGASVTFGNMTANGGISGAAVNTARYYYFSNNSGDYLAFDPPSSNFYFTSRGESRMVINGYGDIIVFGTAYKPGGGPFNDYSDARIKTVLGDYASGLTQILALHPVNYQFLNNDPNHRATGDTPKTFTGLIAQEVELVMPEMVTLAPGEIDGVAVEDMRVLDMTALPMALINAIKTLDARLTALEGAAP